MVLLFSFGHFVLAVIFVYYICIYIHLTNCKSTD